MQRYLKLTILLLTFLTFFSFANSAHAAITVRPALNLGLVGYWSMDEGTGGQVGDSSGNGNDGTIFSPVASDNFDRANENPLSQSGNWDIATWSGVNLKIVTNEVVLDSASDVVSDALRTETYSDDQYSKATIKSIDNYVDQWLLVRAADGASTNGYGVEIWKTSAGPPYWHQRLFKSINGTNTWLGTEQNETPAVGDDFKVTIVGDMLSYYRNGILKDSVSVTGRDSGVPGIGIYDTVSKWDNFEAGNISGIWVDGKRGKALSFDGTKGKHVAMQNTSSLSITGNITISAWAKFNSLSTISPGKNPRLLQKGYDSSPSSYILKICTDPSESCNGELKFNATLGSVDYNAISSATLSAGQWYHLVGVREGTTMKVYINGAQNGDTSTVSSDSFDSVSESAYIGESPGNSDGAVDGLIDETRIYNRALSATEISNLYQSGAAKFLAPNNTGLVGSWSFEEGTGAIAGDSSGNGNDGTIYSKVASDDFNRTNENPIQSPWTQLPTSTSYSLQIDTNQVKGISATGANNGAYYNSSTFANDQYGSITLTSGFTSSHGGILLRANTSGEAYYVGISHGASGFIIFRKYTGGAWSSDVEGVTQFSGDYANDGDVFKASIEGYNLKAYVNGSLVASWTDTGASIASGKVGIYLRSLTQVGDNWEGGDVSGTWIDGKRGKALSFDGTNDYVDIPRNSILEPATAITVSTWFYWNDHTSSEYGKIINKSTATEVSPYRSYEIYQSGTSQTLQFGININGTSDSVSGISISENAWHHLVGTWSSTDQTIRFYVDGVEAGNDPGGSGSITYYDTPLRIGWSGYDQANTQIDGQIDEVRIYNRALGATEIADLYNSSGKRTEINSSQNSRLTSGLVGLWSFNGPDVNMATNTAYDRSGNNNNGTITGATQAIGKVGQALSFNGSSDYISVSDPGSSSLDIAGELTLTAWIKKNSFPASGFDWIVGKISSGASGPNYYLETYDNELLFGYYSGGWHELRTTNSDLQNGAWYHVTAVYNDAANSIILYVNGEAQAETILIGNPENNSLVTNNYPLYVGSVNGTSSQYDGRIDEVRIYNRVLSAAEVQQLYNMGR